MLYDIKLITYDLDGTLIDSSEAICRSFNFGLSEVGEPESPAPVVKAMIGTPIQDMYRRVLPVSKHEQVQACVDRFVEVNMRTCLDYTRLLDGAEDILRYFHSRGLMQSIATTKSEEEADMILRGLDVRQYFELLIGCRDVKHPKPNPEAVLTTLHRLGIEPDKAVMIGDTTYDVECGRGAGVYTVGVSTPHSTHSRDQLLASNPTYLISSLSGLENIVSV